jgi:hypothetical protein
MAGRGPQSFKKRQKEQQRKEKHQEKLARRLERKRQIQAGEKPPEEEASNDLLPGDDEDLSHIPGIVD